MNPVMKGLRKHEPDAYRYLKGLKPKDKEKMLYKKEAETLGDLFSWYETKQGYEYWKEIADKYKREPWVRGAK